VDFPSQTSTPPAHDLDQLREQLVLLAARCPHTKSNPPSCPLHGLRQMEPSAIIDWLDGLQNDEREFLLFYHQCCLMTWRERNRAAARRGGARRGRAGGDRR
jgi:hypothetical protein